MEAMVACISACSTSQLSTQGWKTKSTSGNHGNLVQCTVVPQSAPSRRASNEGSRFMDGGKVAMHFSWAEY